MAAWVGDEKPAWNPYKECQKSEQENLLVQISQHIYSIVLSTYTASKLIRAADGDECAEINHPLMPFMSWSISTHEWRSRALYILFVCHVWKNVYNSLLSLQMQKEKKIQRECYLTKELLPDYGNQEFWDAKTFYKSNVSSTCKFWCALSHWLTVADI